jgi:hypothetical protein
MFRTDKVIHHHHAPCSCKAPFVFVKQLVSGWHFLSVHDEHIQTVGELMV